MIRGIVRGALVAAAYVAVSYALAPISFGPLQFRLAEALALLPIAFPEAVAGLFVGCLVTNLIGPYGLPDIVFGSLITLVAAAITRAFRHSPIAYLAPVVLNAVLVSAYLTVLTKVPYWMLVLSIGASEAISVLAVGVPILRFVNRRLQSDER
ncbi:MAG: QueT transporter family protein [Firmicutes bacterium]|nr:QueT transporter family protein [Bacillota bacterium]MDH7494598.1 QueT transporter family protein [Bacillota bacterium]